MPEGLILEDVIAISGHRVYPDRSALYSGLDRLHARRYYLGGARGVDTDALNYLADTQPGSIRHVVVPNRVIDQPAAAQAAIKKNATVITELKNTGRNRFQLRNRFMVDRSQRLSAFYDGRKSGGTYNTIKYARMRGKPVTLHSLSGYKSPRFTSAQLAQARTYIHTAANGQVSVNSCKGGTIQNINQTFNLAPSEFLSPLSGDFREDFESYFNDYLDF